MTIPSYDNRRSYAGDGTTTVFAFPPPFTVNADLVVQIQATDGSIITKVLGTDYSVTGAGNPSGGNVTMTVAPALTTTLIIYRDVPLTQSVNLQDGGPLPANTINKALDRITMWGQRLKEQVSALGTLATQTVAGLMSAADKIKLDGVQAGAQVNAVTSVAGKTGVVTLVKGDVGLGNVDNTSDLSKPISTATQAALDAKAAKAANLSDLANADAALANLGGGATGISVFKAANSSTALTAIGATATGSALVTAANAAAARSTLGLVIGTDVQAYDADLAAIAAITPSQGDILYHNGTAWTRLAAGTNGWFLRTNGAGANPSWINIPGGGDMLAANNLSDLTNIATARTNLGATSTGVSLFTATDAAAARTAIGAGTGNGNGTVTSIAMTVPTFLSVSGSPVTTSGTFAVTLSGTALPAINGGTGQNSYAVGDLLYASTTTALSKLADVATGNALISGGVGVAPSWGKIGLTTHISGTLAIANGGTNITTYAAGDILYASAANTLSKLAIGSTGQVLSISGGVPVWTSSSSAWPAGTLYGLTLSQASATTVGIAVGGCANEDGGTAFNMVLGSAITKSLSAWAAGTTNGALDTGTIAASTWYHVHLIRKDSDGSIDALLSLSATAPTMPSGYTARRRLGSIFTNASSQVTSFLQIGDRFIWVSPVQDVNVSSAGTAAVSRTLSVPTGVSVRAIMYVRIRYIATSVDVTGIISPLNVADIAPGAILTGQYNIAASSSGSTGDQFSGTYIEVQTNTSAQLRTRLSATSANLNLIINTIGWFDTRGA